MGQPFGYLRRAILSPSLPSVQHAEHTWLLHTSLKGRPFHAHLRIHCPTLNLVQFVYVLWKVQHHNLPQFGPLFSLRFVSVGSAAASFGFALLPKRQ